MTTVAQLSGARIMDKHHVGTSPLVGFTAVNGRSSPSAVDGPAPSGERASAAADAIGKEHPDARAQAQAEPQRRAQERPAPEGQQEPRPRSPTAAATSAPEARRNSTGTSPTMRKRSYPDAFGESSSQHYRPRPAPNLASTDPYYAPERFVDPHRRPGADQADQHERQRPLGNKNSPHAPPTQAYYTPPPAQDESDTRLAEALRQENGYSNASRDTFGVPDDDESHDQAFGDYGPQRTAAGVTLDADRKRRKRVFSNRTKTGCLTCRKRKKKCDELHPECNNCLRGGFVCEGYNTRNTWQKPSPVKTPVPLQSKTGPYPSGQQRAQRFADSAMDYAQPPRLEIHALDEAQREDGPLLNRAPPTPSESREHQHGGSPKSYPSQMAPRYHDHDRPDDSPRELPESVSLFSPTASQPAYRPPLPPPPPSHHQQPAFSHSAHHPTYPPPVSSLPPTSAPAVAQAALQHANPGNALTPRRRTDLTEREKMLKGEYYLPYTPALMADREQCAAAVWRFNSSTNPNTGLSAEDRSRFFKQILGLRPTPDSSTPPSPRDIAAEVPLYPSGSVGPGVVVEAPFHCDYGYNITIGADVVMGPDCRITDTCNVTIGNNVVFSPGVKLVCATYAIDPRERRKGRGRALARSIVIEDDVWIGSNVTVLPGVRVGRCSTVGAGSLLHTNVPPYTVVAGNPQKVIRGIYDDGRD